MRNGSKTEETMHFCFFVVLPTQGQIGLTKLLASNGQSICLLRQNQQSLLIDKDKLEAHPGTAIVATIKSSCRTR